MDEIVVLREAVEVLRPSSLSRSYDLRLHVFCGLACDFVPEFDPPTCAAWSRLAYPASFSVPERGIRPEVRAWTGRQREAVVNIARLCVAQASIVPG